MSFTADISKFVAKANGNVDQVVRKVTLDLARSVVLKSPVDTGRFRANWVFGVGAINTQTTDAVDKGGQGTLSQLAASIGASKAGGQTYISNSLPYAERLEYGWSQQAASGMVRVTLAEFDAYVRRAVQGLS